MKNKFLIGALSVIGSQICWATIEIAGTFVYRGGASPITLLSVRYLIASVLMFLTIIIFKKSWLKVQKQDIGILLLLGFVLLIHLLAFWQGIKTLNHIPTAISVYFTFPVWIVVFSAIFWKESFSKRKILSLILGLTGSLFIIGFLPQLALAGINFMGVGLMFIAAMCWAIYTMIGKSLFKKYNPFTILFYTFLFVLFGTMLLQNPATTLSQINATTLPNLIYMGIVCTFIAFMLFYNGVKKLIPSTVGIIAYIKPILGVILSFLILNQVINLTQGIGMGLILFSSYLIFKKDGNSIYKK